MNLNQMATPGQAVAILLIVFVVSVVVGLIVSKFLRWWDGRRK